MGKFGTGTAQAIWGWWENFHREQVRNQGLWGIIKGIIPFIIALVGTIIMGIVDAVVEFFVWIGSWFNATDDDNARNFINRSSCAELVELSDDRIVNLINSMLDGPTGDDDENAILKLLECLSCDRLRTIVRRIGRSNIEDDFHGSEYDRLRVLFGNCGIISFRSWDDDASRLFINRSDCDRLNRLSDNSIIDLINNMLSGTTGDADENAILKLLGCLSCDRLRIIVERIGRRRLEDDFHGSEFDRLRVLFGNCGIISFGSWDDDATRIFINNSTCDTLNALSINNIMALLRNLFDGATGDSEERAIIKLIRCLDSDKVRDLVSRRGFSKDDFDDEVDGSEWRELSRVFRDKGV